ncbi:MAG: anti-sigma factor [Mesorhizobium sp.]
MTKPDFPDEMLMRFADGELDPQASAAIEAAMETDDDLVARVGLFIETRAEAKSALKPLLDEPVPEKLVTAVERMVREKQTREAAIPPSVKIIPLRPAVPRNVSTRQWMLPIAASIAAVIGGLYGYWLALSPVGEQSGLQVAGIDSTALSQALATVASGQEKQLAPSQRFRAIATFRDSAGVVCREFEVDSPDRSTVISVACRQAETWRFSFAVVAPGTDAGYAPASSTEALDAYLTAIDAKAPMEAAEEATLLRAIAAK